MPTTDREASIINRLYDGAKKGRLTQTMNELRRDGFTQTEVEGPITRLMERYYAEERDPAANPRKESQDTVE